MQFVHCELSAVDRTHFAGGKTIPADCDGIGGKRLHAASGYERGRVVLESDYDGTCTFYQGIAGSDGMRTDGDSRSFCRRLLPSVGGGKKTGLPHDGRSDEKNIGDNRAVS